MTMFGPSQMPTRHRRQRGETGTHAEMVSGRVELTGLVWRPLGWELAHAAFRTLVLVAAVLGFRATGAGLTTAGCSPWSAPNSFSIPCSSPPPGCLRRSLRVLMVYAGYGLARHASRQDSKMAAAQCL
jgi:hypothetical protein